MHTMYYEANRLALCEANKGKVRGNPAPKCFRGSRACLSAQLTEGLRWTLDNCCINDIPGLPLTLCDGADSTARYDTKDGKTRGHRHHQLVWTSPSVPRPVSLSWWHRALGIFYSNCPH